MIVDIVKVDIDNENCKPCYYIAEMKKKNHYLSFIRPRILYTSSLDSLNNLVSHFNRERFLAKKNVSSCYEETERHFTIYS